MKEASAYAPGHLTGLFQICDQPDDPLLKGARGSGVSITRGIHTKVKAEPDSPPSYTIRIDGEVTNEAFVSENVLNRIFPMLDQPYRVEVEHLLEIPIGAGFGSSGVGALTLALAMNEALGLGLSDIKAAQIAHLAEIECKTGLGTVFAVLNGGFGVLLKPGGPGIGKAFKYDRSDELAAVYLSFGPIPTKEALKNEGLRKKINELGGRLVDELEREFNPPRFMKFSRRFTEHLGIATPKVRNTLKKADEEGYLCTMAMFGEVVFSLVGKDDVEGLIDVLVGAAPGFEVNVAYIDELGARITKTRRET